MPAQFFTASDPIPVDHVPMLIYGPPKCGKSSLVQTFETPLTLDFDSTGHRAFGHKDVARFDTWAECLQAQAEGRFANHKTIVIDTVGRMLERLMVVTLAENTKNGRGGALNQAGWGVLGRKFLQWLAGIRELGSDIVFVCHEKETQKEGEITFHKPDLAGQMAWAEIHRSCDAIGRLGYEGKKRYIDFSPSEEQVGGNPAGWERMWVPDLATAPAFMADLLKDAKSKMGKVNEKHSQITAALGYWYPKLAETPPVEQLNGWLAEVRKLEPPALQKQVMHLFGEHARRRAIVWDKAGDCFAVPKAGAK